MEVDRPSRVIINERTGTIVMGKEVRVSPVAIMHGNLTVEIQTILQVSQPAAVRAGHHGGSSAADNHQRRREGPQSGPERRRHGGATGASPELDRIDAAGYHRDSAKPARGRCARSRPGSNLMTIPSLPGAGVDVTALVKPPKKDSPEKIKDAASQFEALMIGQILKAAHGDSDEGSFGGESDPASASAMDFANDYFARAMAAKGGLGLTQHDRGRAAKTGNASTGRQPG